MHAPGIDYRLTDAVLDPPDADVEGMETPVRLPHAFFCYTPPPAWGGDLAVSELPALERGAMTFGAFNEMAKVTTDCLTAWAKVLNAVKGSRLLWRARCFEEAAARELGYARLHKLGLQRSQVDLLPMDSAPARHMAIYSQVDIHLDTFPYTGGTTTCDALWHGVPVVTLQGVRPSDRLGATVLHHVGRDEWIAHCSEAYVDIALRLAGDVMALQHCRATLRQQFAASPMHDAAGFARGFEHVCRNRLATHRHAVVA